MAAQQIARDDGKLRLAPGGAADATAHERVAEALAERLDEAIEAISAAVVARVPEYAVLDERQGWGGQWRGARLVAELFISSLDEGASLTAEVLDLVRAVGAEQAALGVGDRAMVAGIRESARAGYPFVVAAVREDADGDVELMADVSQRFFTFVDALTGAMVEGWHAHEADRAASRAESRMALVEDLIEGGSEDDDEIAARAGALGCSVSAPCGVFVVAERARDTGGAGVHEAVARVAQRVPGALAGRVRVAPVRHGAVLVPREAAISWSEANERVAAVAREQDVVVLMGRASTLAAVAELYRRQQRYAAIAARVVSPETALVTPDDLHVYGALSGSLDEHRSFIEAVLGPVLAAGPARGDELLATLDALFANGGRDRDVAEVLCVHVQTVRNRFRRIRDLTGLDPRHPSHQATLFMALHVLRMRGDELPAAGDPHWQGCLDG